MNKITKRQSLKIRPNSLPERRSNFGQNSLRSTLCKIPKLTTHNVEDPCPRSCRIVFLIFETFRPFRGGKRVYRKRMNENIPRNDVFGHANITPPRGVFYLRPLFLQILCNVFRQNQFNLLVTKQFVKYFVIFFGDFVTQAFLQNSKLWGILFWFASFLSWIYYICLRRNNTLQSTRSIFRLTRLGRNDSLSALVQPRFSDSDFVLRSTFSNFGGIPSLSVFSTA